MDTKKKESGNCTLPVKAVQVRVLLTHKPHIENKHSYDTLNSKEVGH
jgi:hypothetical protein